MTKKIGGGLKPRLKSKKDFSLSGVFGVPNISTLPTTDFIFTPRFWKNQGELDDCTGNAVTEVSEDEEGIELSAEFQFFLTKVFIEKSPDTWGANLMDACLSAVTYGSIPKLIAAEFLKNPSDRTEILNPTTWPQDVINEAIQYKKGSVFTIDYPYSVFTNLRLALWDHREEVTGKVMTCAVGCMWYAEWTNAYNGIIPETYSTPTGGHAFKICGQKLIDGTMFLVAQLSNGQDIGDNGLFYFPESVVDKEFAPYGQFMLIDMPEEKAKYLHDNGISVTDNWLVALTKSFISFILNLKP